MVGYLACHVAGYQATWETHPHRFKLKNNNKKNEIRYIIYEEKWEKSQTGKRQKRRCMEVQQEGKGKKGEKRRKGKKERKGKERGIRRREDEGNKTSIVQWSDLNRFRTKLHYER